MGRNFLVAVCLISIIVGVVLLCEIGGLLLSVLL